MQLAWISDKTQVAYSEKGNGAAFFRLPGSPPIAKAVVIDFVDGKFFDVSWTVAEVREGEVGSRSRTERQTQERRRQACGR